MNGAGMLADSASVASRIEAGESHVIRMKVPDTGDCVFTDRLRGEITMPLGHRTGNRSTFVARSQYRKSPQVNA